SGEVPWFAVKIDGTADCLMQITTPARRRPRHTGIHRIALSGSWLALALMLLVSERPAHAYIDPGSGSLIYQTALGLLLGFGFMFRRVAAGVVRLFRGRSHDDGGSPEDSAADHH